MLAARYHVGSNNLSASSGSETALQKSGGQHPLSANDGQPQRPASLGQPGQRCEPRLNPIPPPQSKPKSAPM